MVLTGRLYRDVVYHFPRRLRPPGPGGVRGLRVPGHSSAATRPARTTVGVPQQLRSGG